MDVALAQTTVSEIEKTGWKSHVLAKQEAAYQFWKMFDNGIYVVVEIKKYAAWSLFLVLSCADHRCTQSCESAVGTAASIEVALEIAKQCCEDWDSYLENLQL